MNFCKYHQTTAFLIQAPPSVRPFSIPCASFCTSNHDLVQSSNKNSRSSSGSSRSNSDSDWRSGTASPLIFTRARAFHPRHSNALPLIPLLVFTSSTFSSTFSRSTFKIKHSSQWHFGRTSNNTRGAPGIVIAMNSKHNSDETHLPKYDHDHDHDHATNAWNSYSSRQDQRIRDLNSDHSSNHNTYSLQQQQPPSPPPQQKQQQYEKITNNTNLLKNSVQLDIAALAANAKTGTTTTITTKKKSHDKAAEKLKENLENLDGEANVLPTLLKFRSTSLFVRAIPLASGLCAIYLLIGVVFYTNMEHWTLLESIYFAIQTGLNVGYGDLLPDNPNSALFTAFYIIFGNTLFGGALALFVESALVRRRVAEREAEDCYLEESIYSTPDAPVFEEVCYEKSGMQRLSYDLQMISKSMFQLSAYEIFTLVVKAVQKKVDPDVKLPDEQLDGVLLFRRNVARFISDFISSSLGKVFFSYSLLYIWIGIGATYGVIHEGYDIPYSILFSVSNISTFGLIPPSGDTDDLSRIAIIIFLVGGVGIYISSLGRLADVFIELYENEENSKKLEARKEMRRIQSAYPPRCDIDANKETIAGFSWSEFLEYELLRKGMVTKDMIADIRDKYDVQGLTEAEKRLRAKQRMEELKTARLIQAEKSRTEELDKINENRQSNSLLETEKRNIS